MKAFLGESRADRYLLIGTLLLGFFVVTAPVGLALIFYGMYLEHQDRRAGKATRPAVVTALAIWGMANGLVQTFGGQMMLFAYDSAFLKPIMQYYGTFIDLRYWEYGYNTAPWGGVADVFETSTAVMNGFFVFPIYTVANYGFFRMKKWGYFWTVIFSWVCAFQYLHYLCNHTLAGNMNIIQAGYPIWGWALMNYPYITCFFALPYLHTVDKEIFKR